VLEVEEEARLVAIVLFVNQHGAATEEVAVTLQREVDHSIEERMARADESRQGLPRWGDEVLLEGDPLVAMQHGLAGADQPVALAYDRRDVGDLVAAGLPLAHGATKPTERLQEERLDVVGLEPPRLGPLHVLADALKARGIEDVVDQRLLF
jgi:hypothetical protein